MNNYGKRFNSMISIHKIAYMHFLLLLLLMACQSVRIIENSEGYNVLDKNSYNLLIRPSWINNKTADSTMFIFTAGSDLKKTLQLAKADSLSKVMDQIYSFVFESKGFYSVSSDSGLEFEEEIVSVSISIPGLVKINEYWEICEEAGQRYYQDWVQFMITKENLEQFENDMLVNNNLADVLKKASDELIKKISIDERIAIYILTQDDKSEFIEYELGYYLNKKGFRIIDRREFNILQQERLFQTRAEVDENTVVSMCKTAGATIVITGSITGTGNLKRLRLRALDTENGEVISETSIYLE